MADQTPKCSECGATLEGRDVYEGICYQCRERLILGTRPAPKPTDRDAPPVPRKVSMDDDTKEMEPVEPAPEPAEPPPQPEPHPPESPAPSPTGPTLDDQQDEDSVDLIPLPWDEAEEKDDAATVPPSTAAQEAPTTPSPQEPSAPSEPEQATPVSDAGDEALVPTEVVPAEPQSQPQTEEEGEEEQAPAPPAADEAPASPAEEQEEAPAEDAEPLLDLRLEAHEEPEAAEQEAEEPAPEAAPEKRARRAAILVQPVEAQPQGQSAIEFAEAEHADAAGPQGRKAEAVERSLRVALDRLGEKVAALADDVEDLRREGRGRRRGVAGGFRFCVGFVLGLGVLAVLALGGMFLVGKLVHPPTLELLERVLDALGGG